MRTLLLVLLCLIFLAPSADARPNKDDSSNNKPAAESKTDSKDKSSNSSSRSSDSQSSYRPSSETKNNSGSGYHPSAPEPVRSTPREDPPRPVVHSEPKPEPPAPKVDLPKPAEDTSRKSDPVSYRPSKRPDSEPAKFEYPTPPASDNRSNNSSSATVITIKATKRQEKAKPVPQPSYHPSDATANSATVRNADKPATPAPIISTTSYHPSVGDTAANRSATTPPDAYVSKRDAKLQRKADQEKARQEARNPAYDPSSATIYKAADQAKQMPATPKPAYKPAGQTGYIPTGQINKTVWTVERSGRHGDTTTGPTDYRPRHEAVGYIPRGSAYNVGYHPSKYTKPTGYRPPTLSEGRWHYSTPPIVQDRRRHHPAARFPRPCYYGHWATDYYPGFSWRSCYFYFGIYPYLEDTQIRECPQETIEFVSEPIYVTGSSYVYSSRWDRVDEALADIRSAWIAGRFDLLQQHVQPKSTIAVLTDGQYDYAVSSDDYLSMTEDALAELNTVSFVWNKVRERQDGTIMAFAEHSYWSSDRATTVYVSYTLKKSRSDYFMTEIGSSANPLN